MLVMCAADASDVVNRVLVFAAWICCALVMASFALFVRDQLVAGSKHQQQLIASTPAASAPVRAPHQPGQPRRFIEGAAHTLTSPFDSIVASDSPWVNHGMPTVFALLVYGAGLGYLARYSRGLS